MLYLNSKYLLYAITKRSHNSISNDSMSITPIFFEDFQTLFFKKYNSHQLVVNMSNYFSITIIITICC